MHINLETNESNAIQSYTEHQIQINSHIYTQSVIVSKQEIITDFQITQISDLTLENLEKFLILQPEIIILGLQQPGRFPDPSILSVLSKQRIGLECMSIGAASRTFNVLLGEERAVVVGFVFDNLI